MHPRPVFTDSYGDSLVLGVNGGDLRVEVESPENHLRFVYLTPKQSKKFRKALKRAEQRIKLENTSY